METSRCKKCDGMFPITSITNNVCRHCDPEAGESDTIEATKVHQNNVPKPSIKTEKTVDRKETQEGNPASPAPFEKALEELESNNQEPELWAKAYALTEDEDARKKHYVRERAKLLSLQAGPDLRNLGKFGLIFISLFVFSGASMLLGALELIGDTGSYSQFLSTDGGKLSTTGLLIVLYLILFNMTHKRITGYRFGKWPLDNKLRPRFFFGIWVGMFSFYLLLASMDVGFYLVGGAYGTPRDHLGMAIINSFTFLLWVLAGLVIAFFYRIKVR